MSKHIFIIIGSLECGGAERHLTFVLPHLVQKGWTITVVSLSPHVTLAPLLIKAGVKVVYPSALSPFYKGFLKRATYLTKALWQLYTLYRTYPTALFHYFLPEAYLLGMIMALVTGHSGPRVMSRRSLNTYQEKRRVLGWLEKRIHKFCHVILANSKRVLDQLVRDEHIPVAKVQLIYNGISMPHLPSKPQPVFTLMIVANLIPYKGHHDLIQALGFIKNTLPPMWQLWCVGHNTGTTQQELQALCDTLDLTPHVHFLGPRHDVETLWTQAHVGLLTSHQEGFSNAILEGMAAGVPMIVTDVGGNAEAVVDGITGYVVPAHNPPALAKAILDLANDTQTQHRMGRTGQERLKQHFTLDVCVNAYHELYTHLVKDIKPCAA